ncbi:hypothetical protein LJC45_03225 [Alistipes sp. OttesenSCG-928-B03]|nr:hypothetical protein [Alistipes sp. OttesenSCG-928-B03]
MKKIILFIAFVLIGSGCGICDRKEAVSEVSQITITKCKPSFHPFVEESILSVSKNAHIMDACCGESSLDSLGLFLVFTYREAPEFFHADTVAFINTSLDDEYRIGYRGSIILSDTLKVAVFDKDSVGQAFYNESKLLDIPLDEYSKKAPTPVAIRKVLRYVDRDFVVDR